MAYAAKFWKVTVACCDACNASNACFCCTAEIARCVDIPLMLVMLLRCDERVVVVVDCLASSGGDATAGCPGYPGELAVDHSIAQQLRHWLSYQKGVSQLTATLRC